MSEEIKTEIKTEEVKPEEERPKRKPKKGVVLDIDDVVVSFMETLIHLFNEKKGTCLTPDDLTDWDFKNVEVKDARGNITKGDEIRQFFEEIEPHGLYAFTTVYPQAKQALDMLSDWGYKIILLTARKEQYKIITELSLLMGGIKYDKIIFDWDKCRRISELNKDKLEIVAFVDDKYSTTLSVKKLCNLPFNFVVSKAHNRNIELAEGIIRINSVLEMLRYL